MLTYLKKGWYTKSEKPRLRSEVMDGAIDVAGMLFRAGTPSSVITQTAIKLRALSSIVDPFMKKDTKFGNKQRQAVADRLGSITDDHPELHGLVDDCLDHVHSPSELRALYLHLVHISQMVQLLGAAMGRRSSN